MLRPIAITALMLLSLWSCGNHDPQPYLRPDEGTNLFPKGGAALLPPEGTVPQRNDIFDEKVTKATLLKGQSLFEKHCVVCHGINGTGEGLAVKRGLAPPPSYLSDELLSFSAEDIVRIVTEGEGRMPSYARRLTVKERWYVAHFIKALQLSRRFPINSLDEADKKRLP